LSPRTTTTSRESISSILSKETLGTRRGRTAVRLDLDLDNLAEAIEEQEDEGEAHPD